MSDNQEISFLDTEYPCEITDSHGIVYPTVAHAMAAASCQMRVRDRIPRQEIEDLRLFAHAYPNPQWRDEEKREKFIMNILRQKFSNPELKQQLLEFDGFIPSMYLFKLKKELEQEAAEEVTTGED